MEAYNFKSFIGHLRGANFDDNAKAKAETESGKNVSSLVILIGQ